MKINENTRWDENYLYFMDGENSHTVFDTFYY